VLEFIEIRLKGSFLDQVGLPDIDYPVPIHNLESSLFGTGNISYASLLYWLQVKSNQVEQDWKQYSPAMDRLAELIVPPDDQQVVVARSDAWWVELGSVDMRGKLVTIQKGEDLIAAISKREDGRLRMATFWPLDSCAVEHVFGLARHPHPEHGVNMRENNWEYALDASASMGNVYASERGDSYLSYWEYGIGIQHDKSEVQTFSKYALETPRKPSVAAIELGVYYEFAEPLE